MSYSDVQFAEKLHEKLGNIRYFKTVLREMALIGARQQLTDTHVDYFIEIQNLKDEQSCTWETAIKTVLSEKARAKGLEISSGEIGASNADVLTYLKKILETLERIERKL